MSPLLAGLIGFALGTVVGLAVGVLAGGFEFGLFDVLELVD